MLENGLNCMLACGNILFSFYCDNIFFKKGLYELLDEVYCESKSSCEDKKDPQCKSGGKEFYLIDIVVLSSRIIYEYLPKRDGAFGDESNGVIVFCSEKMNHVIKGLSGYENAFFFTEGFSLLEVRSVFLNIISGGDDSHEIIFKRINIDRLTDREMLVSKLIKKGKSQQQISNITGINVKTVSSHLRSAMTKYHVNNVLEYIVKISYDKDMKSRVMTPINWI
ncbi:TPA: helix-turn-helix domain-containing protein [Serratia fonticola]